MRVDKFIWCIRLTKTRSLASKACVSEKAKLNGNFCKPSKGVSKGDILSFKELPIWRTFKVLDFPKSRVGAKLVDQYLIEITSHEDLKELEHSALINRQNSTLGIKGRPTKKDRRDIDKFSS